MKKKKIGLFWKIVVAILAGVAIGYLFAHCGAAGQVGSRLFKTFNLLFSQVLKFIVPLLILGLVSWTVAYRKTASTATASHLKGRRCS